MTWFFQTHMIPPPLLPWNRNYYHQWRNAKLNTFFPLENNVFHERQSLVAIVWVVEDVVIPSPPSSLPAYLICLLSSPLSSTCISQAGRTRLSVPQNIIYPGRDANSSGPAAESAPSPSGLREPCSERKTSMQKSHFTCSVIISFSFFPQPFPQKCIESFAFGSKLQGIEEREEDLQKV